MLSVIVGSLGDCILNQRLLRKGVRVKRRMPEELTGLVEAPVSKRSINSEGSQQQFDLETIFVKRFFFLILSFSNKNYEEDVL